MIHKLQPAAPIYSFDPVIPPTKHYENVLFHNIALTDKPGTIKLYIPKVRRWALTQYASTDKEKISAQLMEDFDVLRSEIEFAEKESVSSTLDTFELNPYFIKIDVEGQEELVVKGAISTILESKPILLIEIQSYEAYRSMQRIMDKLDYFNLRWPQSTRSMSLTSTGCYSRKKNNYLWIPKSKSDNWVPQTIR
jgi:FkbM family methyltransferase